MVIVWRLRDNIIRTVLYIANVLLPQWAQTTNSLYSPGGPRVFVFLGCMIYLYVLFFLGELSHFKHMSPRRVFFCSLPIAAG